MTMKTNSTSNATLTPKCPFQPGVKITVPEKFWGREYEKNALISRLKNMGSSVIVGERRIGKSSLAYYAYNYFLDNHSDEFDPVWVDCQDSVSQTLDGFFSAVKENSSIEYVSGQTKQDCLRNFEGAINNSPKKVLLFIDEFEIVTDKAYREEFTENFYMQLRSLADKGAKLAIVPTSQHSLPHICKHVLGVSSPFYNIFSTFSLKIFSKGDLNKFLDAEHDGFKFTKKEMSLLKSFFNHRHPLVLQVLSETIFLGRNVEIENFREISYHHIENYLGHEYVQKAREKEMKMEEKQPKEISKVADLLMSIFIPVFGVGILIWEFGWLLKSLGNLQSVVFGIFSILIGMVILLFAGLSVDIIGETTFFKLYKQIIKQIPLFSSLLNAFTDAVKDKTK